MQVKSTKKLKKNQLIFTTMEEMTDFQRFIKVNKLKQTQVAEYLGTSPQYVNQVANGKCALSDDKYELLAKSSWDTSMLTFPSYIKVPASVMSPYTPDDTAAIMSQQEAMARAMEQGHRVYTDAKNIGLSIEDAEIIGEQSPMQRCGDTRPLTNEDCRDCPEKIPFVRSEFVQARDVNIQELVKKEPHRIEFRSMRDFIGFPDYAQKVITEAMVPDFLPGDVLFIQYLSDNAKVMSGAIYLVDTKLYGAMVRQVFVDEGHFVLHSKNPDYKELKLRKDDVYSFALVLHSLRSNFRISSDMPAGASVFKKREEQLERLLDMNAEAMAEIRLQNERLAEERRRQDEERASERIRHDKLIERILKLDQ